MEQIPLLAVAVILILSVPLAIIDIREHRLPNKMTLSAIAVSAFTVVTAALSLQAFERLAIALALGGVTFGIGYLMAKLNGIGMGDVKYLVAVNISLGWFSPWLILPMLAIGFTVASLVSLGLIVMRKANLKTPIPMGPFLILGFVLVSIELFEPLVTVAGGS